MSVTWEPETERLVRSCIVEACGTAAAALPAGAPLDEVDGGGLGRLSVLVAVESHGDIELPTQVVDALRDLSDLFHHTQLKLDQRVP